MMPRLLVSVRDAEEAREAISGGADVIDVKDPSAGPLGAAGIEAVVAVASAVAEAASPIPWTIACGELVEGGAAAIADRVRGILSRLDRRAPQPWLVKAGLSAAGRFAWEEELARLAVGLPAGISQAAVAYADWEACGAPQPSRICHAAARLGLGTLLVDTFDKTAGGLFDRFPIEGLGKLREAARAAGLQMAVAGRLRLEDAGSVARIAPDIVAIRSAACDGGRMGRVVAGRVRDAARVLTRFGPAAGGN